MQTTPDELTKFVNIAADEMDAELGFVYLLPITPTGADIPTHVENILAKINRLIASGRLVLARNGSQEDALHGYGLSLLREGQELLCSIRDGGTQLTGIEKAGTQSGTDGGNAPTLIQGDTASGVDAFYGWMGESEAVTPGTVYWKPGT